MIAHRRQHGMVPRAALLLAAAIALGGCSTSTNLFGGSKLSDMFGLGGSSSPQPGAATAEARVPGQDDIDCPTIEIRPGAGSLAVSASGREVTPENLRHQLSFGETARECSLNAGIVNMRIGVQ